jgi:glycosyltransferase involved in cell wall biosynthesis
MAAGAPVVATDIPGNDEAIRSGSNGWLVPARDPARLADAVLDLLTHPQRAESFRTNSKQRIDQEFTPKAMLNGLSSIYRQVAAGRDVNLMESVAERESM